MCPAGGVVTGERKNKVKAKVTFKRGALRPEGYEIRAVIRAGAAGTGKEIGTGCTYWPWSPKSVEEMEKIINHQADKYNLDLSWK